MIGTLDIAQNTVSWMFDWGDVYGEEHFWSHKLAVVILIVYGCCLSFIFMYGLVQLYLAIRYIKSHQDEAPDYKQMADDELQYV
ncbi:MAG: hypothetical protein P8O07_10400 [Crocinitomicaceae bacterium]|nr:hypothetical protein [Crocinitomicaceae bacterium]